jgi:hypothetical protein
LSVSGVSEIENGRFRWLARFLQWCTTRNVLLVMTGLQLLWVWAIWWTGATTAVSKIIVLTIYTLIVGLAAWLLPLPKDIAWQGWLENHTWQLGTAVLVITAVFGIYYATAQRVWTFDEEGSIQAAQLVAEEGIDELFANYGKRPWLGRQHPPLMPIIYGGVMTIFGTNPLTARLTALAFALGTQMLIFAIGRQLYGVHVGLVGMALFATFPLVVRLGTAAMVEMPLTFFFALTLYFALLYLEQGRVGWLVGMAVTAVVGLLSKYTMVFVFPAIFGWFVVYGRARQALTVSAILAALGGLVLLAWVLAARSLGALAGQLFTLKTYVFMLATNPYGRQLLIETFSTRLPSAFGLYNLLVVTVGGLLLLAKRQKRDWLLLIWIISVWLPVSLTLPDHRYYLASFPAVALAGAVALWHFPAHLPRLMLAAALQAGGAFYLFVDWARAAGLFVN